MTNGAQFPSVGTNSSIPPIVLLADDDRETLELYSTYFEGAGVWVATATTPDEAIEAVDELKPNLVVTDMGFQGRQEGAAIVETLKENPGTAAIPVIVLTGRAADELPLHTRREADRILIKPVLPDALLAAVRELLGRSARLRERSSAVHARTRELVARSGQLLAKADRLKDSIETTNRPCPSCGPRLEWLERGSIQGVEYDYYRWCEQGCGLYCYERGGARRWIKLA